MKECNICGKDFDFWDIEANCSFIHKMKFGSKYDGEVVELNLCCDCADKVLDMVVPLCKINPIKEV